MTKEIEIEYNGAPAKVVLKKITFGERNECMRKSTKTAINALTGEKDIELDSFTLSELVLLKSIVSAPFPSTIEAIRGLDADTGMILSDAAAELNFVSKEKEKN